MMSETICSREEVISGILVSIDEMSSTDGAAELFPWQATEQSAAADTVKERLLGLKDEQGEFDS